jgi:hypothetical protein
VKKTIAAAPRKCLLSTSLRKLFVLILIPQIKLKTFKLQLKEQPSGEEELSGKNEKKMYKTKNAQNQKCSFINFSKTLLLAGCILFI